MAGKTAILILAAGNSSRLGSPKQLLEVQGKKMLIHVLDQACQSKADQVMVVLGSEHQLLSPLISGFPVEIVINSDWHKGMGNSIKKGVLKMMEKETFGAAIISVCDQPFISSEIFDQLIAQKENFEIIASAYSNGSYGPPTLFSKSQYEKLLKIRDAEGARSLIKKFDGRLGLVPFGKGEVDMDTKEDYQTYLGSVK